MAGQFLGRLSRARITVASPRSGGAEAAGPQKQKEEGTLAAAGPAAAVLEGRSGLPVGSALGDRSFEGDVEPSAELPGAEDEDDGEEQVADGLQHALFRPRPQGGATRRREVGQRALHPEGDAVRLSAVGVIEVHTGY